jgi:hypothetical protein
MTFNLQRATLPARRWLRRGRRALGHLRTLTGIRTPADLRLLAEALRLHHAIPGWMTAPLPTTMQRLTPALGEPLPLSEYQRRTHLIDATVHLDQTVPLGICLRRSLVRYILLRRAGLPVTIIFGARPTQKAATGLAAHAWLELDGQPWMEAPENVQGFAIMYRYPPA